MDLGKAHDMKVWVECGVQKRIVKTAKSLFEGVDTAKLEREIGEYFKVKEGLDQVYVMLPFK